ncbi:MAG TPA: hypothetical protein VE196_11810, partial [Pseudonocardiaceae bacterium]|nr:hypothetical protein [Pseudonocardiaceae bacterium]
ALVLSGTDPRLPDEDPRNSRVISYQRGEARGWRRGVRFAVRRGLTIMLSGHTADDVVRYSELFPAMRALEIGTERVAEVLQEMGVLLDDRRPAFEDWLHRKLDGLAPGIRVAVEAWLRNMHDGGPRSKPRDISSVQNYLNQVRPMLLDWSTRYDHPREVTRDDLLNDTLIAAAIGLVSVPLFGYGSDLIGRRVVYGIGIVATGAYAFPYFMLLNTKVPGLVLLAIIVSLLSHDIQYGPQGALIAESFATNVRYSGAGLGYQLASLIAGGPAVLIAAAILGATGSSTYISCYILGCAALSLTALVLMRRRPIPTEPVQPAWTRISNPT